MTGKWQHLHHRNQATIARLERPVSSVASIDNDQRRTRVVVAPERRRRVAEDDDGGANAARKIVVIFALEFVVPHKVG